MFWAKMRGFFMSLLELLLKVEDAGRLKRSSLTCRAEVSPTGRACLHFKLRPPTPVENSQRPSQGLMNTSPFVIGFAGGSPVSLPCSPPVVSPKFGLAWDTGRAVLFAGQLEALFPSVNPDILLRLRSQNPAPSTKISRLNTSSSIFELVSSGGCDKPF